MEEEKKGEQQHPVTVRFPLDVLEELRKLAKEDDRSFNGEVIRALREFIERRRDEHR